MKKAGIPPEDDDGPGEALLCLAVLLVVVLAIVLGAARCQGAVVRWAANAEADIAGYEVRYGSEPGKWTAALDAGLATRVEVPGLVPGRSYHFVVVARNTAGLRSAPSAVVSYQVPIPKPEPVEPPRPPAHLRYAIMRQYSDDGGVTWHVQEVEEVQLPNPAPATRFWRDKIVTMKAGETLGGIMTED